jgi:ATP-dependent Clp protease adapter protein ClpS
MDFVRALIMCTCADGVYVYDYVLTRTFVCCCGVTVFLQEAHETGVAMVVACAQEKAESYVESMRLNGLIASMEPGH